MLWKRRSCCPIGSDAQGEQELHRKGDREGDAFFGGLCCPIEREQREEVSLEHHRRAHHSRQPAERRFPLRRKRQKPQKQVRQKRYPHLPLDGVFIVADEAEGPPPSLMAQVCLSSLKKVSMVQRDL